MSFALGVLVVAALAPQSLVTSASLAQKVQVIKGKKSTAKPQPKVVVAPELQAQPVTDNSRPSSEQTDARAASLDAREKALAEKEAALDEKQKAQADQDKAKAERQQKQLKQLEKMSRDTQQGFENAADALTGE